jgi:LCP family protein required for cell wall assembly
MKSPVHDYVDDARARPAPKTDAISRGWKVLGWVSCVLSVVLVVASLSAYGFFYKLTNSNITHVPVDVGKQPPKLNSALNILLLGSDTRAGDNAKYGRSLKDEVPRADTTILIHLSPGGGAATGISFPRDLMVDIPACKNPKTGVVTQAQKGMLNSAYSYGGVSCTWKTIEQMTNIHIDHFALVDFSGFKAVVNALGGVKICLTQDVNDVKSHLDLKKGYHVVKGEQALAYVRARHGLGDGSDLSRIKRQQLFLGSVAKKAMDKGTLTNPLKLASFLNATTKSLTVDDGFGVKAMLSLGEKLKGMSTGKVRFVTVPWGAYAPDPNRVALREPDATAFFAQIRNDNQIQDLNKKTAVAKIPPAQVKVRVLNGTGTAGLASSVSTSLKAKGYNVLKFGNPKSSPAATVIQYGTGGLAAATTLAALVPGATPVASAATPAGTVDLILGPGWAGLKTGAPLPTKIDGETKATDNLCKQT